MKWSTQEYTEVAVNHATKKVNTKSGRVEDLGKISSGREQHSSIKCNLCYKPFTKHSNMRRHFFKFHYQLSEDLHTEVSSEHLNSFAYRNSFACSLCDLRFINDTHLDAHLKEHCFNINIRKTGKEVESKRVEVHQSCSKCTKSFPSKRLLHSHKKYCHLRPKQNSPQTLHNHMNSVNSSKLKVSVKKIKKTFQCDKCPKRYYTQISLDFHVTRKHSLLKGTKRSGDFDHRKDSKRTKYAELRDHQDNQEEDQEAIKKVQEVIKDGQEVIRDVQEEACETKCLICGKSFRSDKDLVDHCILCQYENESPSDERRGEDRTEIAGLSQSTNETIENFFAFLDSYRDKS